VDRKYVIKREIDGGDWVGVGVEILIDGKPRRHAIEFNVRKIGHLTDEELIAKAKPLLDQWEESIRG
jgi:hypothetical protein